MIKRLKNKLYNSRFKGLFATDGTLSQKTARSGVWVMGSFGFSKVLGFVQTIILARLLLPEDFGLMGICYVAIAAMAVFTETGFNQALIQRKDHNDDVLNTAWVISVIRGVILFLLLFILAPVISRFYDNGQIESILKVIAFSFLLSGFNNIGLILFNKELNFKKKVVYDQLTAILSIVATVSLAFWLRNVWALVLGNVTGAVIGTSLSYWAHPFRPRFSFRINIAKELFHFGKWIFLSGVILFFITQGDDALVGKVLGMSALGFYLLAYKLSNLPATAITNVISQVSFPAYSKIQHNIESLRNAYGRILKFTALISIPLAVGLFILATDFVRIAYGERWLPMVPAMMILCIFGLVRSLGATTGPLFQSVGKPHIVTQLCAAELLIIIIIIYPLSKALGIFGTSIAVTIPLCLINIFSAYKVSILLKDSIARYIKLLFPIVISTVIMAISLYIFKMLLGNSFSLVYLVLAIIASIIIYITSIVILDKESLNLFKLVKNI